MCNGEKVDIGQLVMLALQDPKAYGDLIRVCQPILIRFLHCLQPMAPRADVEDMAQEALIRAWKGLGQLENPRSFVAFLLGIGHNVAHEHRKKLGADFRRESARNIPAVPSPPPGPLSVAAHMDMREAILLLRPAQRNVIVLRFFVELSYPAIAHVLDIPVTQAYRLVKQALLELRRTLGKEYWSDQTPEDAADDTGDQSAEARDND